MQRILTETRRKREADVDDALVRLPEIREGAGLSAGWEPADDDDLLLAAEAASEKRRHDSACAECPYTVETCEQCRYNAESFRSARYSNAFFSCIPACAKYKVRTEQRHVSKLIGESGMGARFQARTFDTFYADAATESAKQTAEMFCEDLRKNPLVTGLMLIGPYGCGKTHLAAAILHRAAEYGVAGMFIVVPELLARIRSSYRLNDGKAEALIEAAKHAPLLILDDLGAEKASEWVKEQIYMLVNYRYEYMLPTIITTNNDGAELERELGRRTLSRLAEMTVPIKIEARDYRIRIAKRADRKDKEWHTAMCASPMEPKDTASAG